MRKRNLLLLLVVATLVFAETEEELRIKERELELQKQQLELEREKLKIKQQREQGQTALSGQQPAVANQPVVNIYQNQSNNQNQTQQQEQTQTNYGFAEPVKKETGRDIYVEYTIMQNGTETTTLEITGSETYTEEFSEQSITGYRLKIGFGEYENNRHEIMYSSVLFQDADNPANAFWYNYVITIESWKSDRVLPFVDMGIGFGSMKTSEEFEDYYNMSSWGYTAFGVGFGAFFQLSKNIEAKVSYRFDSYSWNILEDEYTYDDGTTEANTLDYSTSLKSIDLAIAYRF